uniref:Uncharacterized protein n=1 Tax=Cacopsylla melanoneura TaxID=428564 RepID=A0A8D8ZUS1_9HEMI
MTNIFVSFLFRAVASLGRVDSSDFKRLVWSRRARQRLVEEGKVANVSLDVSCILVTILESRLIAILTRLSLFKRYRIHGSLQFQYNLLNIEFSFLPQVAFLSFEYFLRFSYSCCYSVLFLCLVFVQVSLLSLFFFSVLFDFLQLLYHSKFPGFLWFSCVTSE